eukprot:TRINITY_DN8235_c0_g1_i4.p1 TRINITY_DN8235_c0_g1~~TRINITY_DN8235_c0_g1_i4.p1  ORF type:complete len:316 (-),score=71.05 TRINITY_DN8235_c0_g1_i4:137-1084(-)
MKLVFVILVILSIATFVPFAQALQAKRVLTTIKQATGDYTIATTDRFHVVLCDAAGAIAITLPDFGATERNGEQYTIVNIKGTSCTVKTNNGSPIEFNGNTATTHVMTNLWDAVTAVYYNDGATEMWTVTSVSSEGLRTMSLIAPTSNVFVVGDGVKFVGLTGEPARNALQLGNNDIVYHQELKSEGDLTITAGNALIMSATDDNISLTTTDTDGGADAHIELTSASKLNLKSKGTMKLSATNTSGTQTLTMSSKNEAILQSTGASVNIMAGTKIVFKDDFASPGNALTWDDKVLSAGADITFKSAAASDLTLKV